MTRLHAVAALVLGLLLPAYSWLDGSGWLAWTMFARSATYRIALRVDDATGAQHAINPTALARYAEGDAKAYLAGADQFRHAPVAESLRRNLAALAALGCRTVPRAEQAWISLETRATLDAVVVRTDAGVTCPHLAEAGGS